MKTKIFLVTLAAIILAAGCQKHTLPSQGDTLDGIVPQTVVSSFSEMYPNAENVSWSTKSSYWVASFDNGAEVRSTASGRSNAWYDSSGRWHMTEAPSTLDRLPQAVQDAFRASEYASWRIDDVDIILRNGIATYYVIEVEGQKDGVYMEVELYYDETGTLVREEVDVDDDYSDCLPAVPVSTVADAVEALYPGARIVEVEKEHGVVEVEIIDADRTERDIYFTEALDWILTETEVRYAQLPQPVRTALETSQFATEGTFDDEADHFLFADGTEYYIVEVDRRYGEDIDLKVTTDGTVTPATRQDTDPI